MITEVLALASVVSGGVLLAKNKQAKKDVEKEQQEKQLQEIQQQYEMKLEEQEQRHEQEKEEAVATAIEEKTEEIKETIAEEAVEKKEVERKIEKLANDPRSREMYFGDKTKNADGTEFLYEYDPFYDYTNDAVFNDPMLISGQEMAANSAAKMFRMRVLSPYVFCSEKREETKTDEGGLYARVLGDAKIDKHNYHGNFDVVYGNKYYSARYATSGSCRWYGFVLEVFNPSELEQPLYKLVFKNISMGSKKCVVFDPTMEKWGIGPYSMWTDRNASYINGWALPYACCETADYPYQCFFRQEKFELCRRQNWYDYKNLPVTEEDYRYEFEYKVNRKIPAQSSINILVWIPLASIKSKRQWGLHDYMTDDDLGIKVKYNNNSKKSKKDGDCCFSAGTFCSGYGKDMYGKNDKYIEHRFRYSSPPFDFDYDKDEKNSAKKKEKKWKDFDDIRKAVLGQRKWREDWENPTKYNIYNKKHGNIDEPRKKRDMYKQVLYSLWDNVENDVRLMIQYDLEDPGPIDNNLNITVVACSSDNNYIPALYNKDVNGDVNTPKGRPKSVMDQDNMTVKMTIGNGEWPRLMTENADTSYATFNNEVKSMFFNKKLTLKYDSNGNHNEPLCHFNSVTNRAKEIMGYCSDKLGYDENFEMKNLGVEVGLITSKN